MFKIENEKLKPFLVLAILQVVFACAVFLNELMSISNRVPGGNFPIEHKYSWDRVFFFCGGAIVSAMIAWIFRVKKPSKIFLPSLKSVLSLAFFLTMISVLSGYESVTGWCCEVSPTRYFGFPFSYIMGSSPLGIFAHFDLVRILKYNFLSYQFFLDLLFWSNIMFIILGLLSLFLQRGKFIQQAKGQGLSEMS
ncbi:hypothetical protein FBQ99_14705 [Chloroflexi bacterium CFX2]|nr:hypothetical protein [Chloroflexi bacterium CFX2]MDL1943581.1 hypothetical protein [Chloroflexi bacterium CFX2]